MTTKIPLDPPFSKGEVKCGELKGLAQHDEQL
jgi:hypothetical protein